jgi:hypothetical protein
MRAARFASSAVAALLGLSLMAPRPAAADGAASTRNIIFGAAAVGGTLLIINHNKKVHEKYAEYDRQQAGLESERNNERAAYLAERQAYEHEAQLVADYKRETGYQHKVVQQQQQQIAQLQRSVAMAKRAAGGNAGFVQPAVVKPAAARQPAVARNDVAQPQVVSYGWGTL